ncbi:MAG: hypothetical protein JSV34_00365 [Candidatus Omnitrophota bacterium]|nr:MAG: hypothetical protein JSV34_00365 [Candidatus Omnitrophota bacterium]
MVVNSSLSKNKLSVVEFALGLAVKLLFVIVIVSLAFVVSSAFFEKEKFFKKESAEGISAVLEQEPLFVERERKDYSQFLNQLQRRDVFTPIYFEEAAPVSGVDRQQIKKIIESLRLVGIKWGAVPKVIIENARMGKTFYLKEGDSFSENIKVEKIGKDSVLLNCSGESFELYL